MLEKCPFLMLIPQNPRALHTKKTLQRTLKHEIRQYWLDHAWNTEIWEWKVVLCSLPGGATNFSQHWKLNRQKWRGSSQCLPTTLSPDLSPFPGLPPLASRTLPWALQRCSSRTLAVLGHPAWTHMFLLAYESAVAQGQSPAPAEPN